MPKTKVREILRAKGTDVVTVPPDVSVRDAMAVLVKHDIGSVVVTDGDAVKGILTERDVLRLGADGGDLLDSTGVADAMTPQEDLVIAVPDDDIGYCMQVMTENRVRHLPIMEEGDLRGIVSIGDVVNALRDHAEWENRYLRDYIRGDLR
jgi:CBS domain-containing protein